MDKARELKRGGGIRFSPAKQRQLKASGSLNGCNSLESSERTKKERVRGGLRVSSSNDDSEMGGGGSEGEEELLRLPSITSDRRLKLNGKAFDDCSTVDPPSVPRKLRSAMTKRNRESVSPPMPDPKKHNHASNRDELPNVNGVRRSKHNMQKQGGFDRSLKQPVSITKEEEEVAEALYALAGIFSDNKLVKSDVESITAKEEALHLPETTVSSVLPSEVSKEDSMKLPYASTTATEALTNLSSCQEELAEVTAKAEPATKPNVSDQSMFSGSQRFDLELNSAAQVDLQGNDTLSKNEYTEKMQLGGDVNLSHPLQISSESCLGNESLQTMQPAEAFPVRKREGNGTLPVSVTVKQEAQLINENTKISAHLVSVEDLRPGVPNGLSDGCQNLTGSSSLQAAAWPDSATHSTTAVLTGNAVSPVKLPLLPVRKCQSWKRCTTHMYICRLIRAYQSTEKKSKCAFPENHSEQREGTMAAVTATSNSTMLKKGLNNILPSANCLVAERSSPHEARIGNLHETRLLQDQQASTASGIYAHKKQSCDFLSLSAASESNNARNGFESSTQLQVPYLHPLVQHPVMPFSLPHARYSSSYPDQLAAVAATAAQQVQMHLPQYLSNPFYGPQAGHGGGSLKHHQQQQQQQQLWAAQMAHYRPNGFLSSHTPKWQNGRHDSPSITPSCTQAGIPPSAPLELLGAKYSASPQQLFAFSSSSPSRPPKRQQQQHHPGSYDEGGGSGFRSDGTPHMQLLCNAQPM